MIDNDKDALAVQAAIDSAMDNYLRGNIDATARDYLIAKAKDAQPAEGAAQQGGGYEDHTFDIRAGFAALAQFTALAPSATAVDSHPDDVAVDEFAAAMKLTLARSRAKGRGGWDNEEPGMQRRLSDMLRAHVEKGDPVDVANFCMFLHMRGEPIGSDQGYVDAFYQITNMLEIGAQPMSPKEAFRTLIRPKIERLLLAATPLPGDVA